MSAKDAIAKREAAKKPKPVREPKVVRPVIAIPVEELPAQPPAEVVE